MACYVAVQGSATQLITIPVPVTLPNNGQVPLPLVQLPLRGATAVQPPQLIQMQTQPLKPPDALS